MEQKRKLKLDWVCKLLIAITLICFLFLIYVLTLGLISIRKIDMPVYVYTLNTYNRTLQILQEDYEPMYSYYSNEKYKAIIEEEAGIKPYIYCEADINGGRALIPLRLITISESLVGYEYCRVFTHEVMHIQKVSGQENYISFETFKFLYESEDEELHNVGVWIAIRQLLGYYPSNEDCHEQIIEYIESKTANRGCLFYL